MKQLPIQFRTPLPQKQETVSIPSTFRVFARIKATHAGKTSSAWHAVISSRGAK
jgi:hypothetical protein